MNKFFLIILVSCSFILSTNAQISKKQKALIEEVMEASRNWANSKSNEEFFSFIGSDALMMAPDKGIIRGHEGIGNALKEFQSIPGFSIIWEPQEAYVSKSGDLGYSLDKILVTFDGEDGKTIKLYEKGISIWKKDSKGEWKMAVDIWNVDPTMTTIHNNTSK